MPLGLSPGSFNRSLCASLARIRNDVWMELALILPVLHDRLGTGKGYCIDAFPALHFVLKVHEEQCLFS